MSHIWAFLWIQIFSCKLVQGSLDEVEWFPDAEVLNDPLEHPVESKRIPDISKCLDDPNLCPKSTSFQNGVPGLLKEGKRRSKEDTNSEKEVPGPVTLKADDRFGLKKEGWYKLKSKTKAIPKICYHQEVPCQKVDSRIMPPEKSLPENLGNRFKRKAPEDGSCDHEVQIVAFGGNYTLCIYMRDFKDNPILKNTWNSLNVSVFDKTNTSEKIPLSELGLKYATGFVKGEEFTKVSGFLIDDHFYGTVYKQDAVHYLEPHNRKTKDMRILGDGLKTLLHTHKVKKTDSNAMDSGSGGKTEAVTTTNKVKRRVCDLTIVSDHLFFAHIGEKSIKKTVLQMLWHIKEANSIFQSKDFDGDGRSECLGFTVSEITVFKSETSPVNILTGKYSVPEDYLKKFSRYNFDGFCLGILFTNRAFSELVLGLSWRGNPKPDGVGGICQNRVRIKSDHNAYSFNALFISLKSSQEDRIPLKMGILNLVHEMMHSFGAKHDPEPEVNPECTPKDRGTNGRFLMSKYSNDGHKLNHEILSPCTKTLVMKNLASSTRTSCLDEYEEPFCGDGIIQDGEECDCGTIFQCTALKSCCVPPEGLGDQKPCTLNTSWKNCHNS